MPDSLLASALARSFLAGKPTAQQVADRAGGTLGRRWRWLGPLAKRFVKTFEGVTRPRHRDVVEFLLQDKGFLSACAKYGDELSIGQWLTDFPKMQPVAAAGTWDIPAIESTGELADWLGLAPGEPEWFADLKGLGYTAFSLQITGHDFRACGEIRDPAAGDIRRLFQSAGF